MPAFMRARAFARLSTIALSLALCAGVSAAEAKSKRATAKWQAAAKVLPPPAPPGQARFFTINQVLAKQATARAGSQAVRLATVERGTASDAPPPAARTFPRGDEPFGLHAFRAPEGLLWVKWRGVEDKRRAEADEIAACRQDADDCTAAAARFLAFVAAARSLSGRARYELVNRRVNAAVRYTSDLAQHGVPDHWSAPLATLASGRGDCEDYAIAKYAVLRESGVAAEDLRIVLLRDTQTREAHAVLAAREGARWFILDNRRSGFYADGDLPHYMPLFALDHQGVKLFAAPYALRAILRNGGDATPAGAEREASGGAGDRPLLI
jgi:predicted transglutaminase-like cysteine proteinase